MIIEDEVNVSKCARFSAVGDLLAERAESIGRRESVHRLCQIAGTKWRDWTACALFLNRAARIGWAARDLANVDTNRDQEGSQRDQCCLTGRP